MSTNDRRIKTIKLRLRSILSSFALIKSFVDEYNEETDLVQVPVRLENLATLWTDFSKLQAELESLDEASIEAQLKQRTEVESQYYRVKGFLLSVNKLPATPCPPSPSSSNAHLPASPSHIRLPDVKLPVFNGSLENWVNFHDLYISLVHSSHDLSNIQKFYYLRSSLSGDALKLIQTIPLSAANYSVAWNLLLEHFQNTSRLKSSYVDALFEFPSMKKESASELHSLVERFEANVRMLQQLGEKTEFWDVLLIRMLSTRLDPTTRRDWEDHSSTLEAVSFKNLVAFCQRRVTVLQTINSKPSETTPSNSAKKQPIPRSFASHGAAQITARKCILCSEQHPLYMCGTFSKMGIEDKEREVRRLQLCRNCLRKGHMCRDCPSNSTCRKCKGRHHTQLCGNQSSSSNPSTQKTPENSTSTAKDPPVTSEQSTASVSAAQVQPKSFASSGRRQANVLLATAVINVVDDNGTQHKARALLDSGSECCFATESFSQLLKVQRKRVSIPIAGIGHSATQSRHKFSTMIQSRISDYSSTVEFLVLPKVTVDLPSTSVDISSWEIPPGVQLADPSFHTTNPIDLILGAEIFFDLFKVAGRIPFGENLPTLVNSVLGWVVSGRSNSCQSSSIITANTASVADLHRLMERFWTIEEADKSPCYSVEEVNCEAHFRQTVTRTSEGRYVVRLPLKEDVLATLGDNRHTAIRRFGLLESRLQRNSNLGEQYSDFMREYLDLGHMRIVTELATSNNGSSIPTYHLPHHAVVREESTTTKLRVVFDASCKTNSGPSLNDALMVGPTVQDDLRSILLRSRTHRVMIVADAKQMYRQVLVDGRDSPLQRIVYRNSPNKPLDTYELTTVTYGTACAPFLATRVLLQLTDDEEHDFPEAATILRKDFYVDDLITGGDSVAETKTLRTQLDSLLARGGFELRKWASNEPAVLEDIPLEKQAMHQSFDLNRDQLIKTLGLHWEPAADVLRYRIKFSQPDPTTVLTKRLALSFIAQLFDPLGLVGPVVTTAKLFMQALWTLKDSNGNIWSWDEELPATARERWHTYHSQLPLLNDLKIERFVLCANPTTLELHLFSDASEHAYGACAYLRSENNIGQTKIALLTAKSKVAPLKQQSIPRLELCGALLAAQLRKKIAASIPLQAETFFWVDSTTVLNWLRSPPSTWNTFVANRVSKIQLSTTNCTWRHVAGEQNPADCLSRGVSAEFLLNSELWWHGPQWLQRDKTDWPLSHPINLHTDCEIRKTPTAILSASTEVSFIDSYVLRFSNYHRMLRVATYCKRFLRNCRLRNSLRSTSTVITTEEKKEAEHTLIRLVQQQAFPNEWTSLQRQQAVPAKSRPGLPLCQIYLVQPNFLLAKRQKEKPSIMPDFCK